MTFKERYDKDYPNKPGPIGCPWNYGYEVMPDHGCSPDAFENGVCKKCWSREIPHSIKDSGDRTQFKTGAVRDMRTGKGRFDLVPLAVLFNYFDLTGKDDKVLYNIYSFQQTKYADVDRLFWALEGFCHAAYNSCAPTMFLEVAKHFEEGAVKYGENNWQKGIPPHIYIDSALRHYMKWLRKDTDEPHDRAFVWNIMCCIWEVEFHELHKEEAE